MEHASSPAAGSVLAIAAVPVQRWETLYDPAAALRQGTIFPSLNLPFFVTDGGSESSILKGGGVHA